MRLLLDNPFALPLASAVRQALAHGDLPAHWERVRQDLVARRHDGNRAFARILELAATPSLAEGDAALVLAAAQPDWNADTVGQLLHRLPEPPTATVPLDATRSPAFQVALPAPDLQAYNRLLEVRS